jgi:hypothetical protein
MTNENGSYDDSGVAIVCEHIHSNSLPILLAVKSEPTQPEDSGWQFQCNNANQEDYKKAKVWSVREVLMYDPTLAGFLGHAAGTKLVRQDTKSEWKILKCD